MTAKEYLKMIKKIDVSIEQKQNEYHTLKKSRTYVGAVDYSSERVQTPPDTSGFTRLSDKLSDMQKTIHDEIDQWHEMRHERLSRIQQLSKAEYIDILYRRYVRYQSLETISEELKFSYNYTCNLHGEALREFAEKFLTNLK